MAGLPQVQAQASDSEKFSRELSDRNSGSDPGNGTGWKVGFKGTSKGSSLVYLQFSLKFFQVCLKPSIFLKNFKGAFYASCLEVRLFCVGLEDILGKWQVRTWRGAACFQAQH